MRINNQNQNFKGALNSALGMFYNPNAAIPTLIIEGGVTLGRTYQANKRGGKKEATERLVEQGVSAVVWLWGVQALKKIGDFIGEKIFNLKGLNDFDLGKNIDVPKNLKNFKAVNILTSTLIATAFIGFILPKINHKISKKVMQKDKEKKEKTSAIKAPLFDEFKNNSKKEAKNISFTSLQNQINSFAHILENNETARLLITDTGVIAGRYHNSRNKYEKIESLFRDISSIYFYLFGTKHTVKFLNKLSKNTDIAPDIADFTAEKLIENLKQNNTVSSDIVKDSKFLNDALNKATKGAYSNPKRYVSNKQIEGIKTSINDFINQLIKNADDKSIVIDEEYIKRAVHSNKMKNLSFHSLGIAFSIFALAYVIPKVQYLITKKLTHENKFPAQDD